MLLSKSGGSKRRTNSNALPCLLTLLLTSGPSTACDFRKVRLEEVPKAAKVLWEQVKRLEPMVPAGGANLSDRVLVAAVVGTAVNARIRAENAAQTIFASYMMHDDRDTQYLQRDVRDSLPLLFKGVALDAEKIKALSEATENLKLREEIVQVQKLIPILTQPFHVCR